MYHLLVEHGGVDPGVLKVSKPVEYILYVETLSKPMRDAARVRPAGLTEPEARISVRKQKRAASGGPLLLRTAVA
jgi:hypothetical protein